MARHTHAVYRLSGTLRCTTALSVAHGDRGLTDDIVCVRDGKGRLVIPGTALAGVLRHALGSNQLWGDERDPWSPKPVGSSDLLYGSNVWVEDSVVSSAGNAPVRVERRDGVGIDRHSGSAATGVLYSREVVPAGTQFSLEILIEETATGSSQQGRALLLDLVALLRRGIRIGGGCTRGLGSIRLEDKAKITVDRVGTRKGILRVLTDGPPDAEQLPAAATDRETIRIEVPWEAAAPLLVKASMNGLVDAGPVTTRSGDQVRFVVPGSSIKGALRSRAERIERTLTTSRAEAEFLDALASPTTPLTVQIFGHAPDRGRRGGAKGALAVDDCHSLHPVSGWGDLVEAVSKAPDPDRRRAAVIAARSKARKSKVDIIDHVALDRWTGGADDGRLFSLVVPSAGLAWEPIRLQLDARSRRQGIDVLAELGLVALVLRDLAEGDVAIGHGASRGYGAVRAELGQATIHLSNELAAALGVEGLGGCRVADLFAGIADGPRGEAVRRVQQAWRDHVEAQQVSGSEASRA